MRTVRTTIAAVVVAGLPAACGGGDGIACGHQGGGTSESVPVAVRLDTGEIRALPRGTVVPFLSLPEVGGFALPSDGGERRYVFHPRA